MLVAERISKSYPTPRGPVPVIEDVSLVVDRGDAVAIMGPSGCGKSTLLYLLGALEPPTVGSIRLDGHDPYALNERAQAAFRGAHVGFIFQDHLLLPQLTALENVLVPTLVDRRGSDPLQRKSVERGSDPLSVDARAHDLLVDLGLGGRLDHRPGELSGGERQRVAIARALIREPSLILCDEPTGNLDRASADAVADVLAALPRDRQAMLVVVTHNLALAGRFGRRYELVGRQLHRLA